MAYNQTEPTATGDFSARDDAIRANFAAIAAAKLVATVNSQVTDTVFTPNPVVQIVNTTETGVETGTTVLPLDDTIPQKTEGDEYMTLAITPKATTNKLKIDVVFVGANSEASPNITVALFQDTTANALAATVMNAIQNGIVTIKLAYYMAAGTTSATTFKVRAGSDAAGTTTFNGRVGGRLFGGVMVSSITITEFYSAS